MRHVSCVQVQGRCTAGSHCYSAILPIRNSTALAYRRQHVSLSAVSSAVLLKCVDESAAAAKGGAAPESEPSNVRNSSGDRLRPNTPPRPAMAVQRPPRRTARCSPKLSTLPECSHPRFGYAVAGSRRAVTGPRFGNCLRLRGGGWCTVRCAGARLSKHMDADGVGVSQGSPRGCPAVFRAQLGSWVAVGEGDRNPRDNPLGSRVFSPSCHPRREMLM